MVIDDVFAVIAEGTRREILQALRTGGKAVGELVEELAVSQPTVSKHLKVLREAGLVSMRAQGQKRFYSLRTEPLREIAAWIADFEETAAAVPAASGSARNDGAAAPAPAAGVPASTPQPVSVPSPEPAPTGAAGRRVPDGVPVPDSVPVPAAAAAPAPAAALSEDGSDSSAAPAPALAEAVLQPGTSTLVTVPQDSSVPQQLGRSVGRTVGQAAERAADLLAHLPKFGRRKD